jgi:riboflavin biosynthesis pyrimidine reductase
MMTSLDGRIVTEGWPVSNEARNQYELVHNSFDSDGWICGRVTFQEHFADGVRSEADVARKYDGPPREDFVAPGDHDSYAFAVDSHGKLAWDSNDIDGDHVVAIVSEHVSEEYLESLRAKNVSYILAGAPEVDLARALDTIGEKFNVKTLMLEGGGRINGGMLREHLIDEISVLIVPVADGRMGEPALFDEEKHRAVPIGLSLVSVEKRAEDVVWLRYRVPDDK